MSVWLSPAASRAGLHGAPSSRLRKVTLLQIVGRTAGNAERKLHDDDAPNRARTRST
jgi:hypothetical protein